MNIEEAAEKYVAYNIDDCTDSDALSIFVAGAKWSTDEIIKLIEAENENLHYASHGMLSLNGLLEKIKSLK